MKEELETLRSSFRSYGHFYISCDIDGEEFGTVTTNTMAIDAGLDDCYDNEDNTERYYQSQNEAKESLIAEIKRKNDMP